jgi:hypothetical protein
MSRYTAQKQYSKALNESRDSARKDMIIRTVLLKKLQVRSVLVPKMTIMFTCGRSLFQ